MVPSQSENIRAMCNETEWFGQAGVCQVCCALLSGRQTVFCSQKCERWWRNNHVWRWARRAARRKHRYVCTVPGCEKNRAEHTLEVNHIVPLVGAGYGVSCLHHQTNLELLCTEHHQAVTNRQREARTRKLPVEPSPQSSGTRNEDR